jgi:hypothetical protein
MNEEMYRKIGESAAQWLERLRRIDARECAPRRDERDLLLEWAEKAAWREATNAALRALSSRPREGSPGRPPGVAARGRSALDRVKEAVRTLSPDQLSRFRKWLAGL